MQDRTSPSRRKSGHVRTISLAGTLLGVSLLVSIGLLTGSASALDETPAPTETSEPTVADDAQGELLREGSTVYSQICSSCHQGGGIGIEGQFPPLIDNPNVDDAAYLESVIENGRQGNIEVGGVTYSGVMPSFSTLSDEDTAAVIAFIQNDFVAPATEAAAPTGPVAGTELPLLTNWTALLAYILAFSVAGLVLAPRIIGENDRLDFPWLDAWLRTGVIVSAVALLTVVIPDWAIRTEAVAKLSRPVQELIGVVLWSGGLGVVLWGLWYAHRRSRI